MTRTSSLVSEGNTLAVTVRADQFNSAGQLVMQTVTTNGVLVEVTSYRYADGNLLEIISRDTLDGEPKVIRTLTYDSQGRFETSEKRYSTGGFSSENASRVYSDSGWITTTERGEITTRINTELDAMGRVFRATSITRFANGSLSRLLTYSYDEDNNLESIKHFELDGKLVNETQFTNYVTIDDVIHESIHRWHVFYDADKF